MAILIKDLNMPKCCEDCLFSEPCICDDRYKCMLNANQGEAFENIYKRQQDCPLIDISEYDTMVNVV